MATGRSGFETVVVKRCPFMRSEAERAACFSNVKSIALELVDKVHRLAVGMGSYGISEVGRRVNGAVLTTGSVAGSGASGGGRIVGAEAGFHNKLAKVRGFVESDRGGFDEEVLG